MTAPHFEPSVNLIKRVKPLPPPVVVVQPPRFGARFWLVLSAAYLCLVRGIIYDVLPSRSVDIPAGLRSLSQAWINIYGALWIVAGCLLLLFAINRRWWPPLFAVAALPAFVWAIVYAVTAVQTHDQSWSGAFVYHAASLLIFWAAMVPPARGWNRR